MLKQISTLILALTFVLTSFAQNPNSIKDDWYFYYGEYSKLYVNSFCTEDLIGENISIIVDSTYYRNSNKCQRLRQTVRIINSGSMLKAKPSILGDSILYKADSVFLFFEDKPMLVIAGLTNNSTFQIFMQDSLEFFGKLEYKDTMHVNGMLDSVYTFSIMKKVKNSPATFLEQYKYGKTIGFIDIPDFYQLIDFNKYQKIPSYSLKFSNAPKIGFTDLSNKRFYDYNVGNKYLYYFDGSGKAFGKRYREVLSMDTSSVSNKTTIEFYFYEHYINVYSPDIPKPKVYNSGTKEFTYTKNAAFRVPHAYVFAKFKDNNGFTYYEVARNNIFYFKNKICLLYQSPEVIVRNDTNWFNNWYGRSYQIYCEGLGSVGGHNEYYDKGSYNYDSFCMVDYDKGNEFWTSITEESTNLPIQVYPNPTNGILNIKSKNQILNLEVFNLSGIKVKEFTNLKSGILNISDLSAGVYFIRTHTNNEVSTFKVIVE